MSVAYQGGGNFLFSLLLEYIGRSNLNTKTSKINNQRYKKIFFCQEHPRGWGNIFLFFIIRDRTFKHNSLNLTYEVVRANILVYPVSINTQRLVS